MAEVIIDEQVYGSDVTWGEVGKGIVVSTYWENFDCDLFRGPDEVIVNHSTIEVSEPDEEGYVVVTITPDEGLKSEFPEALVIIDHKWFDMGALKDLKISTHVDHRIQIIWDNEACVETFIVKAAI